MVRESSQLRLSTGEGEYVVPAGVYYWRGFQNSERDSIFARIQHASRAVVISFDSMSKAMGRPKTDPDVARAFASTVGFFQKDGRVVIVSDASVTIDYAIKALGYTPTDLREEVM